MKENPNDKSTVVSIYPFSLQIEKPGLIPPRFLIPASKDQQPEVLVVGEARFHVYLGEGKQFPVKVSSNDVAASIVNDQVNGMMYVDPANRENCSPGLFWLDGEIYPKDILKKPEYEQTNVAQRAWFRSLVEMGDDDFARTHQHAMVSDIQRIAAKTLGYEREWLLTPQVDASQLMDCPSCFSKIHAKSAICPQCHAVLDPVRAKQFQMAAAAPIPVK